MIQTFRELIVGGVLIAPFVAYAVGSLVILLLLRPLLRLAGFERAFLNPPLAMLGIYLIVLAATMLLI